MIQKGTFDTAPGSVFAKVFQSIGVYDSLIDVIGVDEENGRVYFTTVDKYDNPHHSVISIDEDFLHKTVDRFKMNTNIKDIPVVGGHRLNVVTHSDGFQILCVDCQKYEDSYHCNDHRQRKRYCMGKFIEVDCK